MLHEDVSVLRTSDLDGAQIRTLYCVPLSLERCCQGGKERPEMVSTKCRGSPPSVRLLRHRVQAWSGRRLRAPTQAGLCLSDEGTPGPGY